MANNKKSNDEKGYRDKDWKQVHGGLGRALRRNVNRRSSRRLCGAELGNDSWDDLQGAVDFRIGCRSSQRKAEAGTCLVARDTHGSEDMGGVDGAAAAG